MNCIDVRTLGRYRISRSQDHIDGTNVDPWNLEIQCRFGKVYPHGREYLQAYTYRRLKRALLRDVPGVRLHQWGDSECTVVFPVSVLPAVLDVLKPRMRRTLSPEQLARKVEILRHARGLRGQGTTNAPPPATTLATEDDRALTVPQNANTTVSIPPRPDGTVAVRIYRMPGDDISPLASLTYRPSTETAEPVLLVAEFPVVNGIVQKEQR